MPELPEVETVVRGLEPILSGNLVNNIRFYRRDLREAIPINLVKKVLLHQCILNVFRRSKYIIIETSNGFCFLHLGMSGQAIFSESQQPKLKHTHFVFSIQNKQDQQQGYIHYVDPRRFGRLGACEGQGWSQHQYFSHLGVEPLEEKDLGLFLWKNGHKRKGSIKSMIMNHEVVVGVGNIYACESLFRARVSPERRSCDVEKKEYLAIGKEIKFVLKRAIQAGGTTLKDFKKIDGSNGYFAIKLSVYGKEGEPCTRCQGRVTCIKQAGRSTWFCRFCQK